MARERTFIVTYSNKSRCYRTGKYTVYRRVLASFGPEILQPGAVKGLKWLSGVILMMTVLR